MRIVFLDKVNSTNLYLKELSLKKPSPFLAVTALEQFSGKGRLGRVWWSKKGDSLILSILLLKKENPFQSGMILAHAAVKTCEALYNLKLSIKWPNDLYYKNQKIGGILVEQSSDYLICGIGMNLNQEKFPKELNQLASSLYIHSQKKIDSNNFCREYLKYFKNSYKIWEQNNKDFITKEISPLICWKNKKIEIDFLANTPPLNGILKDISEEGFLIVEINKELKKINSGELKICLQQ